MSSESHVGISCMALRLSLVRRRKVRMPAAGFSLGSNLRVPKVFGGNGIRNAAAPAARRSSKGMVTGTCDWDVYGTQRQRRANDLKEVERIKNLLQKLELHQDNSGRLSRIPLKESKRPQVTVQDMPSLDESSEGLEARMRAEFVMIKDRLRKMEKDLHQLGTTR